MKKKGTKWGRKTKKGRSCRHGGWMHISKNKFVPHPTNTKNGGKGGGKEREG